MFAGIETVQVKEHKKGSFITKPGEVTCKIVKTKSGRSQNPKRLNEPFILVEFEVIAIADGDYQIGERLVFWKPVTGEYNLRDIKSMAAAACKADPSQVTPELMDALFLETDGKTPLQDQTLTLFVVANRKGATDKEGNLYVNTYFSPAEGAGAAPVDPGF